MFKLKKINEKNNIPKPPPKKETRKKYSIENEQLNDKLSILNDIETLMRS